MDKLLIHGGKRLRGEVSISGSKNAALPLMCASLLAPGKHTFSNIPKLRDISTMLNLLEHVGVEHTLNDPLLTLNADMIRADDAPYDVVRTMRASVLVMGPLVGRLRHAKVSLPGGCAIGARPIDLHLKALEVMGAEVKLHDGYVEVHANNLHGANVRFETVTVTGTENIVMAAVLAPGTTVIENAACEPEVTELAHYLITMGAKIEGVGTARITINGVKELRAGSWTIPADRIEAGTLMIAAAITQGDLTLRSCPVRHLETFLSRLRETGAMIQEVPDGIRVSMNHRPHPVDIITAPYPGFATDLQAQFMSLMSLAEGSSIMTETIFENRFMHVPELTRMGADISIDGSKATVKGVSKLKGAPVMATDLRASASLVLAGLAAEGTTEIHRVYHLDRGYEAMEQKLSQVGAEIERCSEVC